MAIMCVLIVNRTRGIGIADHSDGQVSAQFLHDAVAIHDPSIIPFFDAPGDDQHELRGWLTAFTLIAIEFELLRNCSATRTFAR